MRGAALSGGFIRGVGREDRVRALVLFRGSNFYSWVRVRPRWDFLIFCCRVDQAVGGVTGNGQ